MNVLTWLRQSCAARYRETSIWVKLGGQRVADSAASTSRSRTAGGTSAQPTRKPDANVFENEPR